MTKAAQHYGKRLGNFWAADGVQEYVATLEEMTGIPVNTLAQTKRGGAGSGSGTWAHPKLAVFFARWLDVRFAVWCDLTLDEILRGRVEVKAVPQMPPNTLL